MFQIKHFSKNYKLDIEKAKKCETFNILIKKKLYKYNFDLSFSEKIVENFLDFLDRGNFMVENEDDFLNYFKLETKLTCPEFLDVLLTKKNNINYDNISYKLSEVNKKRKNMIDFDKIFFILYTKEEIKKSNNDMYLPKYNYYSQDME